MKKKAHDSQEQERSVKMEKLLFVYNPCSGKGQIRGSLSQVIEILSKKGYDVTVYPT